MATSLVVAEYLDHYSGAIFEHLRYQCLVTLCLGMDDAGVTMSSQWCATHLSALSWGWLE